MRNKRSSSREGVVELPSNRGNAYSSSRMLYSSINASKDNSQIIASSNEEIQFKPINTKNGGVIIFPQEEDSIQLSPNELVNWFKQNKEDNIVGWTIGRFLSGKFTAQDGKLYSENSLSIEIVGLSTDELIKIGKELCAQFFQESILIKDYSSQRILFYEQKKI